MSAAGRNRLALADLDRRLMRKLAAMLKSHYSYAGNLQVVDYELGRL